MMDASLPFEVEELKLTDIILVPTRVDTQQRESLPSDTSKHSTFVAAKMAGRPVQSVPGVGRRIADGLAGRGVKKATQLFGLFLLNRDDFDSLLKSCGANYRHLMTAVSAFEDWYNQHM